MKTRDIDHQVLLFAHKCVAADDIKTCLRLGFDLEDLQKIKDIDTADLYRMSNMSGVSIVSKIEIDKTGLDKIRLKSIKKRRSEKTIDTLLTSGANNKLMSHFFSMTRQEVSNRRKILDVEMTIGRPEKYATEVKERALVSDMLKQFRLDHPHTERGCPITRCEGLLFVSSHTRKPVQEVWEIVESHITAGKFEW